MNTVISHRTALDFWRESSASQTATAQDRQNPSSRLQNPTPRQRKLVLPKSAPTEIELRIVSELFAQKPLHVLVGDTKARWARSDVCFHLCGATLPASSLVEASENFWVSSPEFCFLQLARISPLPELIMLGYELCGLYRLSEDQNNLEKGFTTAQPLTDTVKLAKFLAGSAGINGRKNALRALRYITDNSASPRETALTMLLCLPYQLGGFGFELPKLNERIDMGKKQRLVASKSHYFCDLYWAKPKLAVEYDSDQFHTQAQQIASDAKRRNALSAQGITVLTVTKQQINSAAELNKVATLISKHLRKRIQYVDPDFTRAHWVLRKALFGTNDDPMI
jgi:very-short-patch-repair endonuclease